MVKTDKKRIRIKEEIRVIIKIRRRIENTFRKKERRRRKKVIGIKISKREKIKNIKVRIFKKALIRIRRK